MKRLGAPVAFLCLMLAASDLPAQSGVAKGRVVDENGEPVAGVDVKLEFLGGVSRPPYELKTDDGGRYSAIVMAGRYRVEATKPDYRGVRIEHTVVMGDPPPLPDLRIVSREAAIQQVLDPIQKRFDEAMAATREGRLDDAVAAYTELIGMDPSIVELHYNLATVHAKRGDTDAAEASFAKALELSPGHVPSATALARLYEDAGRGDEAAAVLEKAAAAAPENAELQFRLGVLHLNAGRHEAAEAAFARVAELEPGNAEAHYLLGTFAINRGDVAAALSHLERYLETAPEDAERREDVSRMVEALRQSQPSQPQ